MRASIGEAQHNLSKLIRAVRDGEEVVITRRNRVVARLVPATDDLPEAYPAFLERARKIFGEGRGESLSEIVIDDRRERL